MTNNADYTKEFNALYQALKKTGYEFKLWQFVAIVMGRADKVSKGLISGGPSRTTPSDHRPLLDFINSAEADKALQKTASRPGKQLVHRNAVANGARMTYDNIPKEIRTAYEALPTNPTTLQSAIDYRIDDRGELYNRFVKEAD